jgi:hypothetical protein
MLCWFFFLLFYHHGVAFFLLAVDAEHALIACVCVSSFVQLRAASGNAT